MAEPVEQSFVQADQSPMPTRDQVDIVKLAYTTMTEKLDRDRKRLDTIRSRTISLLAGVSLLVSFAAAAGILDTGASTGNTMPSAAVAALGVILILILGLVAKVVWSSDVLAGPSPDTIIQAMNDGKSIHQYMLESIQENGGLPGSGALGKVSRANTKTLQSKERAATGVLILVVIAAAILVSLSFSSYGYPALYS